MKNSNRYIKLYTLLSMCICSLSIVYASVVTGSLSNQSNSVSNVVTGNIATTTSGGFYFNPADPEINLSPSMTAVATFTATSGTPNARLNLRSLVRSDGTAMIPATIVGNYDSNSYPLSFTIPSGMVVTASGTWDGQFYLPQLVNNNVVNLVPPTGQTLTVSGAVEVGNPNTSLTFSDAVKLVFYGRGGSNFDSLGFLSNGTFVSVTDSCPANNGNALAPGGACYFVDGADLVLWTKHFTTFATYKLVATAVSSGGGGGGGGGSSSGGGGGGGGGFIYMNPIGSTTVSNSTVTTSSSNASTTEVNLPIAKITQKLKYKSSGDEVRQLQKILAIKGFLPNDSVTGYFGLMTEKALKAYQKSYKLDTTGAVGPATMKLLNSETANGKPVIMPKSDMATTTIKSQSSSSSTTSLIPSVVNDIKSKNLNFKIGDENENVTKLQKLLIKYGYLNTNATGYYGNATDKAFKRFQTENQ